MMVAKYANAIAIFKRVSQSNETYYGLYESNLWSTEPRDHAKPSWILQLTIRGCAEIPENVQMTLKSTFQAQATIHQYLVSQHRHRLLLVLLDTPNSTVPAPQSPSPTQSPFSRLWSHSLRGPGSIAIICGSPMVETDVTWGLKYCISGFFGLCKRAALKLWFQAVHVMSEPGWTGKLCYLELLTKS